MDLNNDNISDLLEVDTFSACSGKSSKTHMCLAIRIGLPSSPYSESSRVLGSISQSSKIFFGNFGGDAGSELLELRDNAAVMWINVNNRYPVQMVWANIPTNRKAVDFYTGDMNGDGLQDLIEINHSTICNPADLSADDRYKQENSCVSVHLSNGYRFTNMLKWGDVPNGNDGNTYRFYFQDIDKNGKTDMLQHNLQTKSLTAYISTGNGFLPSNRWGSRNLNLDKSESLQFGDINNDSGLDVIALSPSQGTVGVLLSKPYSKEVLTSVNQVK